MNILKSLQWKPRDLKANVEEESWSHKAKIVGWSCLMFAVADGYNYAMQSVTYRANQLQAKVFAGDKELNSFIDVYHEDYWHAKL